jgi:hypothetical protein
MSVAVFHDVNAAPANTIKYNGKDYYINGMNVPWNAFGSDAGSNLNFLLAFPFARKISY